MKKFTNYPSCLSYYPPTVKCHELRLNSLVLKFVAFNRNYSYSTGQKSPPPSNFTKSINEMNTFLFYRLL